MKNKMELGLPWNEEMRIQFSEKFPKGTISESCGRQFALEGNFKYVVRMGENAVIMPRMAYGKEAIKKIIEMYGEESNLVGEKEVSEACSNHS